MVFLIISINFFEFKEAPPTKKPFMPVIIFNLSTLPLFTDPPYKIFGDFLPNLLFIYLNIADEMMYVKNGLFPGLSDDEVFENINELVEDLEIENAFILEEYVPVAGSQFLIGYQIQDED